MKFNIIVVPHINVADSSEESCCYAVLNIIIFLLWLVIARCYQLHVQCSSQLDWTCDHVTIIN